MSFSDLMSKEVLREQAEYYWKEARPEGYNEFQECGQWDEHVNRLIDQTIETYQSLVANGGNEIAALELARDAWGLFPESEEDEEERMIEQGTIRWILPDKALVFYEAED